MTGLGTGQCGVGINIFRVVVTDKQIVDPDAFPPDATGGKNTFPNSNPNGTTFGSPADQIAFFESIRVKAPERTDCGWLGSTPAGTDNLFGRGPGSGTEGYVDSGPHPELKNGEKAPDSWTSAQLSGKGNGAGSSAGGTSGAGVGSGDGSGAVSSVISSATSGSSITSALPYSTSGAPSVATSTGSGPANVGSGSWDQSQQSPPGGHTNVGNDPQDINLMATGATSVLSVKTDSVSGLQPGATGVAKISAGNCVFGKMRCLDKVIQVCSQTSDTTVGE